VEPVGIGIGIVINVGHNLAGSGFHADVAGTAQPAILSIDQPDIEASRDLVRGVPGSIVDDDYLVVGVFQSVDACQGLTQGLGTVVAAHHD